MAEFSVRLLETGPKKCQLEKKIEGRKITKFGKKWQKRGRKIFLQFFRGEKMNFYFIFTDCS
jgi:hypothetical protein